MPNFQVVKIYEPEPDSAYNWAIIDSENKVVATYGKRRLALQSLKMYEELYPTGIVKFELPYSGSIRAR